MVAELTPGTKAAGRLPDGGRIPVSQTLPGRQPRRDPRRARRRHARLPDAAAQRRRPGAQGQRPRARQHDPPDRADRQALAPGQRGAGQALGEHQARDPQLLAAHGRAGRQGRRRSPTSSSDSNAVFASLASQDAAHPRDAARAAVLAAGHADHARARRRRWPTSSARRSQALRPGRPRARPDASASCGRSCAPRRRSSATSCARSRAPSLPTVKELRPALRDLAAATPDLTQDVQEPQLPAQRARLQPARRHRRGLPVLVLVGQPPGADRVRDPGRARPDPPRPRDLRLPDRRAAGLRGRGQPAARHARGPAQRARTAPALCPSSSQEAGGDGWLSPRPPSAASPRW